MINIVTAITVAASLLAGSLQLYNFDTTEYMDMSVNPVILDLDFCGDVDDAVAVRMITTLDNMDICSLKAAGLTVTAPDNDGAEVKALHGLLEYDGYGNIPIGTDVTGYVEKYSSYWNSLIPYSTTEPVTMDAVNLYKNILGKSYHKVTIITTGYLTNIAALLEDEEGRKLMEEKCERLVIMGGCEDGWENNFGFYDGAIEAARFVIDEFEGEILFVPQEIGKDVMGGAVIQENDPDDPVSQALLAWGTENGKAAFDPYTVLIGCIPEEALPFEFYDIEARILINGAHEFAESGEYTGRRCVRLKDDITTEQYTQLLEGILEAAYKS